MAATLTAENELTYASFPIEKVEQTEDGNVLVWGKATDASVDSDQQIIDADFAAKAMDEFFDSGPNIRVQHQAQRDPAGVGVSFERSGDAHWLKVKVIEPVAKQLVLGGALRAYSVGIARPTIVRDAVARGGRITDGQFVEISLVDRPANKNCGIQLVKSAGGAAGWTGQVFGSDDVIAKAISSGTVPGEDVTLTFPSDVSMSFSPLDMAKIVARKNGSGMITKDVTTVHGGGVPVGSIPKTDIDDDDDDHDDDHDGDEIEKRRLTTEARSKLPDSAFVFPAERRYPIHDRSHARNALARVSQHGTPDEKARVRAAVARRYPGMGKKKAEKAEDPQDAKVTAALARIRVALREAMQAQMADPDNMADPVDRQVWAHLEDLEAMLNHADRDQLMDLKAAAAVAVQALPATAKKKQKAVCVKCGARQNILHKFCTECGKTMDAPVTAVKNHDYVCLGCGQELDKGEQFCPHCGRENPGYNPMADLKIPANKRLRRAVGEDRVANEPDTGRMAEKAKKPRKKGKKGVLRTPDLPDHVFDREAANKSADLAISTSMRLKNLGIGHDMGYAHDLTCPAFSWEDVAKAYPAGLDNLNADAWQRKALEAASSAPLAQAQAASRLGQAVFTIKAAAPGDLMDVKRDINKAFRDANPGPGSFPTPGHIAAQSFRRPKITTGLAAYSRQYDEHGISASVPEGQISAGGYSRPFIQDGRSEDSPANKAGRNMPVPSPNGVTVNLDYSNIHKDQILQAYTAMHDHFDRVFPGVCPMNAPDKPPAPRPLAVKARKGSDAGFAALTEAVIALPDTIKGEVVNALAGQPADAAKPALDRKAITDVLRKAQRTSDRKFSALTDAVSILAEQSARPPVVGEPPQPAFDRKAVAAVLRKAQKTSDKRFLALTEAVSALPGTIKEEVANALPSGEAAQPAFDRDALVAVLSKAQKTSDKRFLTLTKAVNALAVNGQQTTDERFAALTEAVSALPRNAQKGADKKIAALTKAVNALPDAIRVEPSQPELDRKTIAGVLRKAQKESNEKIMALTEAVSVLAEQSAQPAQPGSVRPELDRKTIAAVLRKAQKASDKKFSVLAKDRKTITAVLRKAQKESDEKIAALADDRKTIAVALRKAQRVSDRKIAALTKAMNSMPAPAPSIPGEPAKPGLDRKAVAAVLRKAQKTSDKRFAALTEAVSALADQPSPAGAALDRKAVSAVLRKAQKESNEKITALTAAVNALADRPSQAYRTPYAPAPVIPARTKSSRPADARVSALRKAQKAHDEQLMALTKAVNVLADQPDPGTQAFKGMAVNMLRANKAARPADVQSVAEIAERTQTMMLHELEAQWRNSTDPVQREAAWNASLKMRGLLASD